MLEKLRKSQTILTYAVLIAVVATALVVMSGYFMRRVTGMYKQAGDAWGDEEQ